MADLGGGMRPAWHPETNEALDHILEALQAHGFELPHDPVGLGGERNRDALAGALVRAAIDHEIRVRIDKLKVRSEKR